MVAGTGPIEGEWLLEWRLDEVSQYTAWFASPHTGSEDDRIAFGGLLGELDRP